MSNFQLSQRSLTRLTGVHPDLVGIVKLAIERTPVDFTVVEGVRTLAQQREYVAKGASQTMARPKFPPPAHEQTQICLEQYPRTNFM